LVRIIQFRTSALRSTIRANTRKWTTTALYAGCLFPVGKHFEFDSYYEHQNITNKRPNQQLNQFGLIFDLFF